MIPPERSGSFVAHMERVLDVYRRPFDPLYPVVCLDESPKQLIGESRTPVPCAPGRPARRIPNQETLRHEVAAWVARRNADRAVVDWRFTTGDARFKLRRLYPSFQE